MNFFFIGRCDDISTKISDAPNEVISSQGKNDESTQKDSPKNVMSADAKCDQPPTKVNDEQKVTTSAQENDDQATSQHKMACNLAN